MVMPIYPLIIDCELFVFQHERLEQLTHHKKSSNMIKPCLTHSLKSHSQSNFTDKTDTT